MPGLLSWELNTFIPSKVGNVYTCVLQFIFKNSFYNSFRICLLFWRVFNSFPQFVSMTKMQAPVIFKGGLQNDLTNFAQIRRKLAKMVQIISSRKGPLLPRWRNAKADCRALRLVWELFKFIFKTIKKVC